MLPGNRKLLQTTGYDRIPSDGQQSGVELYSPSAPLRGYKGGLYDLWFGSSTRVNGDDYPADASRQFAQASNLIFPWNGQAMATS